MTFYVAILASYVLVDAETEDQACEIGRPALYELYIAEARPRSPDDVCVRVVRPATDDEIAFLRWHQRKVADERLLVGKSRTR